MKYEKIPFTTNINGVTVPISVTSASTITIDVSSGNFAIWTAGHSSTINLTGSQILGQELCLMIKNDGLLPRVITFGTGFKEVPFLTGSVGATAVRVFRSDGTYMLRTPTT